MRHIKADLSAKRKSMNETERGALMEYFCKELNFARERDGLRPITMARMGFLLARIPTKDLYYIKRVCDDAPNFSKKFWWLLKPKNHDSGQDVETGGRN